MAKAIVGLESLIWRETSDGVLTGLVGEMTMPSERREKYRIGIWVELVANTNAVSFLVRPIEV